MYMHHAGHSLTIITFLMTMSLPTRLKKAELGIWLHQITLRTTVPWI